MSMNIVEALMAIDDQLRDRIAQLERQAAAIEAQLVAVARYQAEQRDVLNLIEARLSDLEDTCHPRARQVGAV